MKICYIYNYKKSRKNNAKKLEIKDCCKEKKIGKKYISFR